MPVAVSGEKPLPKGKPDTPVGQHFHRSLMGYPLVAGFTHKPLDLFEIQAIRVQVFSPVA